MRRRQTPRHDASIQRGAPVISERLRHACEAMGIPGVRTALVAAVLPLPLFLLACMRFRGYLFQASGSPTGEELAVDAEFQGATEHAASRAAPLVAPEFPAGTAFRLEIVNRYPHDPKAYTQGLMYLGNDTLYESVGLYGQSGIRKVDLKTGKVLASTMNTESDFAEGLAYYKGFFWQLIWKQRTVYQYEAESLRRVGTYSLPPELDHKDGWGLASSSDGLGRFHSHGAAPAGETLYVTDSGTKLYEVEFIGGAFRLVRKVTIMAGRTKLQMANELELLGDRELWANVYGKDCIARIRTDTGEVFGWILGNSLRSEKLGSKAEVFNGIAYDREGKRLFVTGKLWSKLFEVRLRPSTMPDKTVSDICVPKRNVFHR